MMILHFTLKNLSIFHYLPLSMPECFQILDPHFYYFPSIEFRENIFKTNVKSLSLSRVKRKKPIVLMTLLREENNDDNTILRSQSIVVDQLYMGLTLILYYCCYNDSIIRKIIISCWRCFIVPLYFLLGQDGLV